MSKWSRGPQAGLTAAFGLIGALVACGDMKIQTVIRLNAAGCELFFLCATTLPDELRIELSRPLGAIRDARAFEAGGSERLPSRPPSMAEELTRLASLLETGLLTRAEFDQLKAQLLAGT